MDSNCFISEMEKDKKLLEDKVRKAVDEFEEKYRGFSVVNFNIITTTIDNCLNQIITTSKKIIAEIKILER